MILWATIVFTLADVRDRECAVACKWAGYDGGVYAEVVGHTYCHCIDAKAYDRIVQQNKRTVLPTKANPASTASGIDAPVSYP